MDEKNALFFAYVSLVLEKTRQNKTLNDDRFEWK